MTFVTHTLTPAEIAKVRSALEMMKSFSETIQTMKNLPPHQYFYTNPILLEHWQRLVSTWKKVQDVHKDIWELLPEEERANFSQITEMMEELHMQMRTDNKSSLA